MIILYLMELHVNIYDYVSLIYEIRYDPISYHLCSYMKLCEHI